MYVRNVDEIDWRNLWVLNSANAMGGNEQHKSRIFHVLSLCVDVDGMQPLGKCAS